MRAHVFLLIGILGVFAISACQEMDRPILDTPEARFFATFEQGDHLALMHHALAPGTGDPDSFDLSDRSTQRNLSELGRKQAIAVGERFRQHGINHAEVYTSQWFRCRETAELLDLGKVTELPQINSFFGRPAQKPSQLAALDRWLAEANLTEPTIFVTHQVVITALSGIFPRSGEIILVKRSQDGWTVVDRLKTD